MISFVDVSKDKQQIIHLKKIRKEYKIPVIRTYLEAFFPPEKSANISESIMQNLPERIEYHSSVDSLIGNEIFKNYKVEIK